MEEAILVKGSMFRCRKCGMRYVTLEDGWLPAQCPVCWRECEVAGVEEEE